MKRQGLSLEVIERSARISSGQEYYFAVQQSLEVLRFFNIGFEFREGKFSDLYKKFLYDRRS